MNNVGGLFIALLCAASCGPSPKPVTPTGSEASGTSGEASTVPVDPTPENICSRVFELKAASCELTTGYELTPDECVTDFRRSFEERGPEARQANISLGRCLLDNATCDAAAQCLESLSKPDTAFRECGSDGSGPVAMPRDQFDTRPAATMTRYSQAASTTKDEPIEVCGIWDPGGQVDWLYSLTCNDGSHPFASPQHAHASRVGNVGGGGRCASIIDLYEVPCPEGTYKIFIDAYVCPQD